VLEALEGAAPLGKVFAALEAYLAKPDFDATCAQIFAAVAGGSGTADARLLLPMLAVATGVGPDFLVLPPGSHLGASRNDAPVLLTAAEFPPLARAAVRGAAQEAAATNSSPGSHSGLTGLSGGGGRATETAGAWAVHVHGAAGGSGDAGKGRDGSDADSGVPGAVWFDLVSCDAPKRSTEGQPGQPRKRHANGGSPARAPRRRKLVPLVAPPQPPAPTDRVTEEVQRKGSQQQPRPPRKRAPGLDLLSLIFFVSSRCRSLSRFECVCDCACSVKGGEFHGPRGGRPLPLAAAAPARRRAQLGSLFRRLPRTLPSLRQRQLG
jgi:hypothetical protein